MTTIRHRIKQGDLEPPLEIQLTSGADPVNLTGAARVRFIMSSKAGTKVDADMVVADQSTRPGVVRYIWQLGDTDTIGSFNAEVQVVWPADRPQTFPSYQYFVIDVTRDLR